MLSATRGCRPSGGGSSSSGRHPSSVGGSRRREARCRTIRRARWVQQCGRSRSRTSPEESSWCGRGHRRTRPRQWPPVCGPRCRKADLRERTYPVPCSTYLPEPSGMDRDQPYGARTGAWRHLHASIAWGGRAVAVSATGPRPLRVTDAAPRSAAWRVCRLPREPPRGKPSAACPARGAGVGSRCRRTLSPKASAETSSAGRLHGFTGPGAAGRRGRRPDGSTDHVWRCRSGGGSSPFGKALPGRLLA